MRIYVDDQGGANITVVKDEVSPTILLNGAKAHAMIIAELKSFNNILCYENHAQDCRVKGPIDVAQTLGASNANSLGTSGNNPLVLHSIAFCPGVARRRGGDNRFTTELSPTVTSNTGDNVPAVCQSCRHEH